MTEPTEEDLKGVEDEWTSEEPDSDDGNYGDYDYDDCSKK